MKKKILIIGTGLAGSIIANELATFADVTTLELGACDKVKFPKIDFIKKKLANVKTFCFGGGGGTNLWHNGLIPINSKDILSNNFKEILSQANQYADKAAAKLFFPEPDYLSEYNKNVSEMNLLSGSMRIFKNGVDCLLYPKNFTKLTLNNEITSFYDVGNISFQTVDKKIESVSFEYDSVCHSVKPDIVIIAAGTFGSPSLVKNILKSLNLSTNNVGKGLIDHPVGFVGKVKFNKVHSKIMHKFSLEDKGNYESCTAARYKSKCGKYSCFAFFRPALTMTNKLSIYKFKSELGASSGVERLKNAFSLKLFHPDILSEIFTHIFRITLPTNTFNILVYFEQKTSDNRVDIIDDKLKIDWQISKEELVVYQDLLQQIDGDLSKVSQDVKIQHSITADWLWSGAHHSGTISLGADESDILDNDLKIRGCDNAFVCDGSVIQEHSYANTGLTIAELGLRLVDKIRNDYK
jgi:hypothetical protein